MAEVSVSQQNWVSGELSRNMRGRFDLPLYASGAERMVNFISETAGPSRFRSGTQFVNPTRRNQVACLIPFQFNSTSSQAYLLEFTNKFIRFYQNNSILTFAGKTITGITQANPGVVTAVGHGYTTGDEVIISGVVGMSQLNNRNFVVTVLTVDTFSLQDTFGVANINTTGYTAYASGGIAAKIVEVASPYLTAELFTIKFAQNADTMYIVQSNHEPMKLTRGGATTWTLALFTRTADPFLSVKVITGITQANPANVTAVGHGYLTGQRIIINGVTGMTQVNNSGNGTIYTITKTGANNFTLDGIDSTAYGAWAAGGYASDPALLPGAIAFYQGRLVYGYSGSFPESIWGSKPLDASGNPQYDDFTLGGTATDAYKFTLSPITGKVDKIQSLVPTLNFLALCTFEGVSKCDGGTAGDPISPVAIDITPAVTQGVIQQVTPVLLGVNLVYIHRSGLIMYSMEFDVFYSAYNAIDKNLANEDITSSGIIQMVFRNGRPPMFLAVRNDGILVGTTTMVKENINGGHRHIFGGTSSKCLSVGNMPRTNAFDQTWVVVERTVNSQTVRYVEYINDEFLMPEKDDYYTGVDATDDVTWRNASFEAQKQYIFGDANLTYDGSIYSSVTMTPGATTGTGITFTAGSAIFTASMVGREIWKKSVNGVGTGRAVITGFTSTTVVTCNILTDFDTLTAMPIGGWYLTTAAVSGIWHLEGQTVWVLTDGGQHADQTVANGSITLQYQASVVHVGLAYLGMMKSMSVEGGGINGPSQGKSKNINRMDVHFLNTLGAKYGSSLYSLQDTEFRSSIDYTGRPSPPCSEIKNLYFEDTSTPEKHIYIVQDKPLPCTILAVIPFMDTAND